VQDKNKWFLVLGACVVLIGLAIVGAISSSGKPETIKSKKNIVLRPTTPSLTEEKIREHLAAAEAYVPPDPGKETLDVIESYRAMIEEAPDAPESPVLMESMGNLYLLKLKDYEKAAYCYEQLLQRYPDYHRDRAYVGLITSLEKMEDVERFTRACNDMMKEFPKDSVEYKWAADKSGAQRWEGPAVIHPGSPEEAEMIRQRQEAMAAAEAQAAAESEGEGEGEVSADTAEGAKE